MNFLGAVYGRIPHAMILRFGPAGASCNEADDGRNSAKMVYTNDIDHMVAPMPVKTEDKRKSADAKLFWNGRSQAVRLPKELRFEGRSEEHTSELQSLRHLVCRLL